MYRSLDPLYCGLTSPGDAALPRLQYLDDLGATHAASFPTPKSVSELSAWLKAAKLALPSLPYILHKKIPGCIQGWSFVGQAEVSPNYIKFSLQSPIGAKATLVIDRKFDNYGR